MFRKAPCPHILEAPQGGATSKMADDSFTAAMEYTAVIEEESNAQDERIIELEDSVDDQTVFTDTTYNAMSEVSMGANNELTEIR